MNPIYVLFVLTGLAGLGALVFAIYALTQPAGPGRKTAAGRAIGSAVLGLLFLALAILFKNPEVNTDIVGYREVTVTPETVKPQVITATSAPATATPSPTPFLPATYTPFPTFIPTATSIPFTGLVINDCPSASLGYHPDSGKPLIFKMYPYVNADGTGDTNVLCEFEVLDLTQEVKIHFSGTNIAIVADWSHGTYKDDGTLKDACPTGWECEGVWVATDDVIVPIGTLGHFYVYIHELPVKQRFTEFNQWWSAFPCEYIATQGHSMWNIRVPAWAQDQGEVGTIYGFGLPVGNPGRLTCPGFPIDWEPLPGQLTTK